MMALVLKLKTKSGQMVLKELTKDDTVSDLKQQLSLKCQIAQNALYVLSGFPPKPINLTNNSSSIDSVGIHTGDTLIVEEKLVNLQNKENENPVPPVDESISNIATAANDQTLACPCPGILMRKVVPADNSCLFTSIGFTLTGKNKLRVLLVLTVPNTVHSI